MPGLRFFDEKTKIPHVNSPKVFVFKDERASVSGVGENGGLRRMVPRHNEDSN